MKLTVIATALITTFLIAPIPISIAAPSDLGPSIASFEGAYINLGEGWGEASACSSDSTSTQCFRTEKELDEHLTQRSTGNAPQAGNSIGIQAVCSTTLKLYANTSFGGTVLALSTRGAFVNLSTWSFSNVTSSYKVGACAATFYDGANGGAPSYPGNTAAGASATSMLAGWNDRVSSVYIS